MIVSPTLKSDLRAVVLLSRESRGVLNEQERADFHSIANIVRDISQAEQAVDLSDYGILDSDQHFVSYVLGRKKDICAQRVYFTRKVTNEFIARAVTIDEDFTAIDFGDDDSGQEPLADDFYQRNASGLITAFGDDDAFDEFCDDNSLDQVERAVYDLTLRTGLCLKLSEYFIAHSEGKLDKVKQETKRQEIVGLIQSLHFDYVRKLNIGFQIQDDHDAFEILDRGQTEKGNYHEELEILHKEVELLDQAIDLILAVKDEQAEN